TWQQVQRKRKDFTEDYKKVLLHDLPLAGMSATLHQQQIRALAAQALKRFDVNPGRQAAETAQALEAYRPHFDSAEQFQQLVRECYEVLLTWAEAEVDTPEPAGGGRAAQAERALQRLATAEALAKAHDLPVPKAFHLRRARYRDQSGDR